MLHDYIRIARVSPENTKEDYEESNKNLLQVKIQLPNGEMVSSPDYRVEIRLSYDGVLGLATELLRAAHNGDDNSNNFWHLRPIETGLVSQQLGVYMHPESCELLISEDDLGSISDLEDKL